MSAKEIARFSGRSLSEVQKEIDFQATAKRLEAAGYQGALLKKKGVMVATAKYSEPADFDCAPRPIKYLFELLEACKFKNGMAETLIHDFFSINRTGNKDRHTQFNSKLRAIRQDALVSARTNGRVSSPAIDRILRQLRGAKTVVAEASKEKAKITDFEYAAAIAETLKDIRYMLKRITAREVEYPEGKYASIYEK